MVKCIDATENFILMNLLRILCVVTTVTRNVLVTLVVTWAQCLGLLFQRWFLGLSHLTRYLFQAEKKITVVTYKILSEVVIL